MESTVILSLGFCSSNVLGDNSTAVIIVDASECEHRPSTGVIISAAIRHWIRFVCFPNPFIIIPT